jgi:hypothetical protein
MYAQPGWGLTQCNARRGGSDEPLRDPRGFMASCYINRQFLVNELMFPYRISWWGSSWPICSCGGSCVRGLGIYDGSLIHGRVRWGQRRGSWRRVRRGLEQDNNFNDDFDNINIHTNTNYTFPVWRQQYYLGRNPRK